MLIAVFLFSLPPYYLNVQTYLRLYNNYNAYNIYAPKPLMNAFKYLEKMTLDQSVILSGEFVSSMVPAFSHNRTILGRDDCAPDYYTKQPLAFDFLNGKMDQTQAKAFLNKYSVAYILFGADTHKFEDLPYGGYPFLKKVFRDGSVIVVKVN